MERKYFYEAVPYSPAEVEQITGLSPNMQRDWRRRKLVERPRRYGTGTSPQEVAEILIVQHLREFGLHLNVAASHAAEIAPTVLWFALANSHAWDFDGPKEERAEFEKYIADEDRDGLAYIGEMVGAPPDGFKHYSIWHSGEWTVTSDVRDVFDMDPDESFGGIVLNHEVLGRKLVETVKRPIYVARPRRNTIAVSARKARKS